MIFLILFIKIFLLFCQYIVIAYLIALLLSSHIKPVTAYLGASSGKPNMGIESAILCYAALIIPITSK